MLLSNLPWICLVVLGRGHKANSRWHWRAVLGCHLQRLQATLWLITYEASLLVLSLCREGCVGSMVKCRLLSLCHGKKSLSVRPSYVGHEGGREGEDREPSNHAMKKHKYIHRLQRSHTGLQNGIPTNSTNAWGMPGMIQIWLG